MVTKAVDDVCIANLLRVYKVVMKLATCSLTVTNS